MFQGTVKFFNKEKGFGFIVPEDKGKDIFVHESGINEPIEANQVVNYDTKDGKKGPVAINVSRA